MKVTKWLTFDESENLTESCGGMGGWVNGHKWEDYIEKYQEEETPYLEALRSKVLEDKLRIGGDEHQESFNPLFEDGTIGAFSFRGWGDLLAAIYNTEEDTNQYSYMDFYMSCLIRDSENEEMS